MTCALDLRGHKAEPSATRRGHSVLRGVQHEAPRRLFFSFGLHVFTSYLLLGTSYYCSLYVISRLCQSNDVKLRCYSVFLVIPASTALTVSNDPSCIQLEIKFTRTLAVVQVA